VIGPPLLERVRARLAVEPGPPSRAAVAALVHDEAGGLLGEDDVLLAVREAVDELAGAGPLEALLRLPGVTDVLVNGHEQVWIDRGGGLERTELRFADDDAVRRLGVRLAAAAGRRLDDAAPWVDVGLPDGTRLHAVLPPVSGSGTCLSLRVLRRSSPDLAAASSCCGGWSHGGWRSWSAGAPARARRRSCPRCWPWSSPASGWCCARTPRSWRPTTRTSSGC
jgi:pilus assembly protein CpaF